jgi:hypothetical protein
MLEKQSDVPEGILALKAVGTVTAKDYARVIEPEIERARRLGRRLRVLLELGADYEGFTLGAVREKTELWAHNPVLGRHIDGYALVSDIWWIRELVHLAGLLLPFPMRVFGEDDRDGALAWLESLPVGTAAAAHSLAP